MCPAPGAVIEDGVTGIIVPVNDLASLIDAAERLARNPDLRRAMGAAARRRCLTLFTLQVECEFVAGAFGRSARGGRTLSLSSKSENAASGDKVRVAHLTTVDLSLRYLVFPQLLAVRDAGGEAIGISAPGPWVADLEAAGNWRHPAALLDEGQMNLADVRAAKELWRILRRECFDILHTHNPKPGLYGRILGRLAGVPVVVNTVHGLYATTDDKWPKRALVYSLEALGFAPSPTPN